MQQKTPAGARKACRLGFLARMPAPPPGAFGFRGRGATVDPTAPPCAKGFSFPLHWVDVEGRAGVFEWSALHRAIGSVRQLGMFLGRSLGTGRASPGWRLATDQPAPEGARRDECRKAKGRMNLGHPSSTRAGPLGRPAETHSDL